MKHYKVKRSKKKLIIPIIIIGIILVLLIGFLGIHKITQRKNAMRRASSELIEGSEPEVLYVDITSEEELWEQIEEMPETVVETEAEKSENDNSSISSKTKYYIRVNCSANTVTIYENDGSGNFKAIKAMICSTGGGTPKSGKYTIGAKYVWLPLFGNVYGHYCTRIGTTHILFHSVPYTENYNSGSLEYWEFDKLGTSASMGCIRLQIKDTKWIYSNIPKGTTVEFYSDSDPGPLGKPSAPKISSNTECRNWDPTDDDSDNPWKSYKSESKQENKQENTNTENKTNQNTNTSTNTNTNTITNTEAKTNTTTNTTNNTVITNSENTVSQNTVTNTENVVQESNTTNTENTAVENTVISNKID